jgi:phosphoribosylglycinamide formyltransferase 1
LLFTFYSLRFTLFLTMPSPLSLGVLISGNGTNLQAIIDAIERGELTAVIRVVISNRPDAYGLTRARHHGLPAVVMPHKDFSSREAFEAELIKTLQDYRVELVVLAGFMRLLSPFFMRAFVQRTMNIHPALLPAFPGTHAQRQAVERGVRISGATVHFVDEEMDHGPIIVQAAVPVYPDDTEDSLSARILVQEHRIYPQAIQLFAEGRLEVCNGRVIVHNETRSQAATLRAPEPA